MAISITRTDARIGIETTPGRLDMESKRASLELHQKQAKVNIETELPRVLINQNEAFASAGIKSSGDISREWAGQGYQQAMEFIAKTAEDGNMLASIENKGNVLAYLAKRDFATEHEFGLSFIPSAGPRFDVAGGTVNIEPETNWEGATSGVEIDYVPAQLNINYSPAVVRLYMQSYPSINITYLGENVDTYI